MSVRQISDKLASAEVQKICLRNDTTPYGEVLTRQEIEDTIATVQERMFWRGEWKSGTLYNVQDTVTDAGWLMVANKQTYEKPAPHPIGNPYFIFEGTLAAQADTVKQKLFGARYVGDNPFYFTSYRVYTIAGNDYIIYSVTDPEGAADVTEEARFTATADGWQTFGVAPYIVQPGTTFDLIVAVTEPDPSPTTWNGDWDYDTPQNVVDPVPGQIVHANDTIGTLLISYTDQQLITDNRKAELQALTVGDIIISPSGLRWAIQTIVDHTSHIEFAVAPPTQATPDGVGTFKFETVTATPITHHQDVNYWSGSAYPQVQGLYGADTAYSDIIPDDNAYGVDIQVQEVQASEDWDIAAHSGDVSGSGASQLYGFTKVQNLTIAATHPAYEEIARVELKGASPGIYEYKISLSGTLNSTINSMYIRFSIDGGSTWTEMRQEPKDITDTRSFFYAFPREYTTSGDLSLILEGAKENGGDIMVVEFCDVIIDQKS